MAENESRGAVLSPGRASAMLGLAVLSWSGNHIVGRAARADIPPIALGFWRWAAATLVLLLLVGPGLWQRRSELAAHWRYLLVMSASGVAGFNTLLYVGLAGTTAINAAWLLSATPIAIMVAAWLARQDRLTGLQGLGVVVSTAGIVLILGNGDLTAVTSLTLRPGDLWVLASIPTWAIYSVGLKHRPASIAPIELLGATATLGVVLLAPFYLWELSRVGMMSWTPSALGSIAYVGVVASVLAFFLWGKGVAALGPSRAGMFLHLMPVFTSLLAFALLGESIARGTLLGAPLVIFGIGLASWTPKD